MSKGQFRKGYDPRRHRLTRAERRRGYLAALEKLGDGDPVIYAWLYRRVRGYYRSRERRKKAC
jgi:hypothetical protein